MTQTRYPIPADTLRCEIDVQRSRFIATIEHVETQDEALAFVARVKQEFPTANHNCWAFICGAPGSTDRIGLSDDGEPHGVAGKPMLTTLQHSGIGDIAVVVTRFFGGIKLGKGGMVKAYTLAVQTAIEQLSVTEKVAWRYICCIIPYSLLTVVKRLLPDYESELLDESFSADITLSLRLPTEQFDALSLRLTDISSGQIQISEP
jgi:uncharacterized YigZ family protein